MTEDSQNLQENTFEKVVRLLREKDEYFRSSRSGDHRIGDFVFRIERMGFAYSWLPGYSTGVAFMDDDQHFMGRVFQLRTHSPKLELSLLEDEITKELKGEKYPEFTFMWGSDGKLRIFRITLAGDTFVNYYPDQDPSTYSHGNQDLINELPSSLEGIGEQYGIPIVRRIDFEDVAQEILKRSRLEGFLYLLT